VPAISFGSGFRRGIVVVAAAVTAFAVAPRAASAINSYNATPAPEPTEVGALIVTWDDDGNPTTPERVDWAPW
jgi:hypothetical protein